MTDRDFLWCALHLMLDEEAVLARLCPDCKAESEGNHCPGCGREVFAQPTEENTGFDCGRYERMMRGEAS